MTLINDTVYNIDITIYTLQCQYYKVLTLRSSDKFYFSELLDIIKNQIKISLLYMLFLEGLKSIYSKEIFIEFTTNVNPCIIRPADEIKSIHIQASKIRT